MNLQLICKIKYHKDQITHILILKDNRICTSSYDNSIIVYNSQTYTKDIIIDEHDDWVSYLYQLYSDNIMSASYDGTLKIFKINKKSYKISSSLPFGMAINLSFKISSSSVRCLFYLDIL